MIWHSRNRAFKALQKHTRPILPKKLRKKLKIPNNFEIFGKFMLQPLLSGG